MTNKKLLIFDLDETLIHGKYSHEPLLSYSPDLILDKGDIHVWERPHARDLIQSLQSEFDYAVWSSASDDYAQALARHMFSNIPLKFVWGRSRCTQQRDNGGDNLYGFGGGDFYWVKDLKKVRNIFGLPLDHILIVDDSPEKAERNYGNLVLIRPFYGAKDDNELILLKHYLPELALKDNVRKIEKRKWREHIQNKLGLAAGKTTKEVEEDPIFMPKLPRGLW